MNIDISNMEEAPLPDVFFTKILLESSSTPDSSQCHNPNRTNADRPPKTQKTTVNSNSALKITLSLTIMDNIDENGMTSWFYNEDLTKYLRIKIIQSRSPRITNALMKGRLDILDNTRFINLYQDQVITVQKEQNESITDFISFDTQQNKRIFNIDYNINFIINDVEPVHLAYFAVCFFDLGALCQDYEMEFLLPNANSNLVRGLLSGEKVIDQGSLQLETYSFFLETSGQVWTGPKHQMPDGRWMTHYTHGPNERYLVRRKMANTKIQDYREIDAIRLMDFDLTPAANIFSKIEKTAPTQHVIQNPPEVYFSDAFISYGTGGQAKFLFQLDYNRIIRDKTQFGNIIDKSSNPQAYADIYAASKITHLKVLRRRVRQEVNNNRLGSPVFGQVIVDPLDPMVNVTMTADGADGNLRGTDTRWGGIRELTILGGATQLRTFTVLDKTFSKLTDGYYQYGIEIEIKDGTVDFLNNQLKRLVSIQDMMTLYNSTASMPKFYNHKAARFTAKLKKYYKKFRSNQLPWVRSIAVFVDVVSSLTQIGDPQSLGQRLYSLVSPQSGSLEGIEAFISLIEMLITKLTQILGPRIHTELPGNETKRQTRSKFKASTITIRRFFNEIYNSNERSDIGMDFLGVRDATNLLGLKTVTKSAFKERITQENTVYWTTPDLESLQPTLAGVDLGIAPEINVDILNLSEIAPAYVTPAVIFAGPDLIIDRMGSPESCSNTEQYTGCSAVIVATSTGQYVPTNASYAGVPTNTANDPSPLVAAGGLACENILGLLNVNIIPSPPTLFSQIAQGLLKKQDLTVGEILGPLDLQANGDLKETSDDYCEEKVIITEAEIKRRKSLPIATMFIQNLAVTKNIGPEAPQRRSRASPFVSPVKKNMQTFDLNSDMNALALMRRTKSQSKDHTMTRPQDEDHTMSRPEDESAVSYTGESSSTAMTRPDESSSEDLDTSGGINFDLIPNQIRSLMLGQSDAVANQWPDTDIELIKNVDTSEYYRYNYDMISQVEYLSGYKMNSKGVNLMMAPKFTLLKNSDLEKLTGTKILLCRVRQYTNEALGVGISDGIDIKSFDQYFLVSDTPANFRTQAKTTAPTTDTTMIELNLTSMSVGNDVLGTLKSEVRNSAQTAPAFQSNMSIAQTRTTKLDVL